MSAVKKLLLASLFALACLGAATLPASAKDGGKGPGQLKIESVRVATLDGPLSLRVRATVHTRVELRVNGRLVRHPFEQAGERSQEIDLHAGDGLRPGVNRLRLRATRHGSVTVAERTVGVPRQALTVHAGDDSPAVVRVGTRLGVASAGPARYRWRIVGRTPGATARLTDRDQPQPVLHPSSPGTFELRMTADPAGPGAPVHDTVTVAAAPDDPPIGVALNTINDAGAIEIGGATYGGGALSYVVLERTTRAVVESGSVDANATGLDKLNGFASKYGGGGNYMRYLMIVSGRQGIPQAQGDAAARLFKGLGSKRLTEENFLALRVEIPFSIVGIPGAPAGAATTRIPGGYIPPVSGAIAGYLQKNQAVNADGTPIYDYAAGEHVSFDTRAPGGTSTTNTVKVGDQSYSASLPEGSTAGLHLVVLESLSLRKLSNVVLKTNGSGADRGWQSDAAAALKSAIEKPGGPTVIVQTVGKPKAGPMWAGIVTQLTRLGANPQLVNALDGSNEYALVARLGSEQPAAESSTAFDAGPYPAPDNPPARLVGMLSRTRVSTFEPNVSATPSGKTANGGVNLDLVKLAYQPQQGWPALASGAPTELAAAHKYICETLGFCRPADSCSSLRDCYWQKYTADWGLKYGVLTNLGYQSGKGFGEATFKEMKAQLLTEIAAVSNVQDYLRKLQEPLEQSAGQSYVDLQNIGQTVWSSVQRPAPDNTTSWVLGLIGKAAAVGELAGPPVSAGAAGLAAIFGLASYLTNKEGLPILGSEVKAKAAQLGTALYERISAARVQTASLGMLIVSDYGKLTAADGHVDSDWSLPANPAVAGENLRTAAKQWFYESLVPVAYPYLIRGYSSNARLLECPVAGKKAWPNQPDDAQMQATVGYDDNGNPIRGILFFSEGIGGGSSPPAGLADGMFKPRSQGGLGMEKLTFFAARTFNNRIVHAVAEREVRCDTAWLPGKF